MVFSSHLFLLIFLPLTVLAFHGLASRQASTGLLRRVLIFASLLFYAAWSWLYLGMLLASIVANFGLGRLLARRTERRTKRWLLILGVSGNLALLAYFKYANFFLDNLGTLFGTPWSLGNIVLPLAISFYTFQQISFLVRVHQGRDAEISLENYCLFVLFFPQLIAGPIVRHEEVSEQFAQLGRGPDRALDMAVGSAIFVVGLAKKTLLADPLAGYAHTAFSAAQAGSLDPATAWLGTVAYSLQLYFDFCGYSEMAVGLGRMFGVYFPINFWSPYRACNIAEFWRRWHMTLSRFLRDHLYFPLGGNRRSRNRTYLNLLVTMILGGLWHGAAWTFVLWGAYHGALLALFRLWREAAPPASLAASCWGHALGVASTFLLVALGWVLFRSADVNSALVMYQALARPGTINFAVVEPWAWAHVGVLLLVVLLLPNTWQWIGHYHAVTPPPGARQEGGGSIAWKLDWRWAALLAGLAAWTVLAAHRYTEFLYFQF